MRKLCLSVLACAIAVLPTAAHLQDGVQLQMAAFSDLPRADGADAKRVLAEVIDAIASPLVHAA